MVKSTSYNIPNYPGKKPNGDLTILSWNVQDIKQKNIGYKSDLHEFTSTLSNASIICLQETKEAVDIPDYLCFNSNRKTSRSGGLCIGFHRSLEDHIEPIEVECDDIQAFSISQSLTSIDLNLMIVNVYDSQENSSYKKRRKKLGYYDSTLDILMHFIGEYIGKYEILIVGDLNARTGLNNFIPKTENFKNNKKMNCYGQFRGSRDETINDRGKKLLDMVSSSNLTILNGNTVGDVMGEYTCYQYNGCSVVDYMIASQKTREAVKWFKIQPLCPLSDHVPLLCCLKANTTKISSETLEKLYDDAPLKPKWRDEITHDLIQNLGSSGLESKIIELESFRCLNENDIYQMIDSFTSLLENASLKNNHKRKIKKRSRKRAKYKWFDNDCMVSKKELNKLAKKYNSNPSFDDIRLQYYSKKKSHKKLIKQKKDTYIGTINEDILSNKHICWSTFNTLKKLNEKPSKLDIFDMQNFHTFFKELYKKRSPKHPVEIATPASEEALKLLNEPISTDEVSLAIKSLKNGKAVGYDRILNEQIKAAVSLQRIVNIISRLFNSCLDLGVYPWNTTILNPLYKNGYIHNPDNYRAIAIGSSLGKLFGTILLQRLVNFRAEHCPDTNNQLGFCKSAQTSDHIFTIKTCIDKYVKSQGKRLYTCFIDFRKAFDTVGREALLYKLSNLGFEGKFLNCLRHMYQNSKARVKMAQKLSESIDILSGTEQGHPMSPELFKVYINGLSHALNNMTGISSPELNKINISHLLWADDIVLMALDRRSLQKLIDEVQRFCNNWGLEVNLKKTAVMIFNKSGRQLKESFLLTYEGKEIPSAKSYCYLGITFSLSGSFKEAQKILRQKGLRAYFALKKNIDLRSISKIAVMKLFDSLILPVVSYGVQIWLDSTSVIEFLTDPQYNKSSLKKIATDPLEKLHLAFLKWTIGVGKNTSNAAVWGDCGRPPLGISLTKQAIDYFNRIKAFENQNADKLICHAFAEQRKLNLPWYKAMTILVNKLDPHTPSQLFKNSTLCKTMATDIFIQIWEECRIKNNKLTFYNSIKHDFSAEPYLHLPDAKGGKYLSKIRMSAHKFNIETGRHGVKHQSPHNKACEYCTNKDVAALLVHLPFFECIQEDELHILRTCPRFHHIRMGLKEPLKSTLFADISSIFKAENTKETGKFLMKIFKMRFPNTMPNTRGEKKSQRKIKTLPSTKREL